MALRTRVLRRTFAGIVMALVGICTASQAAASPIWVTYEGTLTTHYDYVLGFDSAFQSETFIGVFVFDVALQPAGPFFDSFVTDYFHVGAITTPRTSETRGSFPDSYAMNMSFGAFSFAIDGSGRLDYVFEDSTYYVGSLDDALLGERTRSFGTSVLSQFYPCGDFSPRGFLECAIAEGTTFGLLDRVVDTGFGDDYFGTARILSVSDADPVPEPVLLLMLSTGLAGIAATLRRRRQNDRQPGASRR